MGAFLPNDVFITALSQNAIPIMHWAVNFKTWGVCFGSNVDITNHIPTCGRFHGVRTKSLRNHKTLIGNSTMGIPAVTRQDFDI